MAGSKLTVRRRAVLDTRRFNDLWTEWKSRRDEILKEHAGGPARASATVGIKRTEKVILTSDDGTRGTDMFVSFEYSTSVSLSCPQTDEDILTSKALASELAAEENLSWIEEIEPEVLDHLRQRRLGETKC